MLLFRISSICFFLVGFYRRWRIFRPSSASDRGPVCDTHTLTDTQTDTQTDAHTGNDYLFRVSIRSRRLGIAFAPIAGSPRSVAISRKCRAFHGPPPPPPPLPHSPIERLPQNSVTRGSTQSLVNNPMKHVQTGEKPKTIQ